MSMIGDNTNTIDYAKEEVERLQNEYPHFTNLALELKAEGEAILGKIVDPDSKGVAASIIKRTRDAAKRFDGVREVEKMPHFRRGQGADQFFNGLIDLLARRERKNRPGIADQLQQELTEYDTRVLMAEQERRRKIAAEEARKAEVARAEQQRLEQEAEQRRLEAERARKPETTAAKEAIADKAEEQASAARIEQAVSADKAEAAYVETLAKPANVMRQRGADGTLTTMARENYAEITDASKLDKDLLWPFISIDAKEKALRTWARTTGHNTQMDGASIGNRPKSVVR